MIYSNLGFVWFLGLFNGPNVNFENLDVTGLAETVVVNYVGALILVRLQHVSVLLLMVDYSVEVDVEAFIGFAALILIL